MAHELTTLVAALGMAVLGPASADTQLSLPSSIQHEHQELHATLTAAIKAGGKTGEAAKKVEEALSGHFAKEESYALPVLSLLGELARGKGAIDQARADLAVSLAGKLRAELPTMLAEHQAVAEALKGLRAAAQQEGRHEYVEFTEQLMQHAKTEEEIFYPAAIVVGDYLKLRRE